MVSKELFIPRAIRADCRTTETIAHDERLSLEHATGGIVEALRPEHRVRLAERPRHRVTLAERHRMECWQRLNHPGSSQEMVRGSAVIKPLCTVTVLLLLWSVEPERPLYSQQRTVESISIYSLHLQIFVVKGQN
jgi:hypothetical protein